MGSIKLIFVGAAIVALAAQVLAAPEPDPRRKYTFLFHKVQLKIFEAQMSFNFDNFKAQMFLAYS